MRRTIISNTADPADARAAIAETRERTEEMLEELRHAPREVRRSLTEEEVLADADADDVDWLRVLIVGVRARGLDLETEAGTAAFLQDMKASIEATGAALLAQVRQADATWRKVQEIEAKDVAAWRVPDGARPN